MSVRELAGGRPSKIMESHSRRTWPGVNLLGSGELGYTNSFWRNRRILIAGETEFIGPYLVDRLGAIGCRSIFRSRSGEYNPAVPGAVRQLFRDAKPHVLILIGQRASSGASASGSAKQPWLEPEVAEAILEGSSRAGVSLIVQVIEDSGAGGFPLDEVQLRNEFGGRSVRLGTAELYGPGQREVGLTGAASLIRTFVDAVQCGAEEVVLARAMYGAREYLHVDDCARGILLAAEHYQSADPASLGTGKPVPPGELCSLVAAAVGFTGRMAFTGGLEQPPPDPTRDISRALLYFGFRAHISVREGIQDMVANDLGSRLDTVPFPEPPVLVGGP